MHPYIGPTINPLIPPSALYVVSESMNSNVSFSINCFILFWNPNNHDVVDFARGSHSVKRNPKILAYRHEEFWKAVVMTISHSWQFYMHSGSYPRAIWSVSKIWRNLLSDSKQTNMVFWFITTHWRVLRISFALQTLS